MTIFVLVMTFYLFMVGFMTTLVWKWMKWYEKDHID